ncbi:MAG: hypothetical protein CBE07_003195 [Pelagibacteraceae bacterium TMED247]|nr:MAG: hypothetical protein CBE07_003195 [Pelagibacteraceae bacterium TMED247]
MAEGVITDQDKRDARLSFSEVTNILKSTRKEQKEQAKKAQEDAKNINEQVAEGIVKIGESAKEQFDSFASISGNFEGLKSSISSDFSLLAGPLSGLTALPGVQTILGIIKLTLASLLTVGRKLFGATIDQIEQQKEIELDRIEREKIAQSDALSATADGGLGAGAAREADINVRTPNLFAQIFGGFALGNLAQGLFRNIFQLLLFSIPLFLGGVISGISKSLGKDLPNALKKVGIAAPEFLKNIGKSVSTGLTNFFYGKNGTPKTPTGGFLGGFYNVVDETNQKIGKIFKGGFGASLGKFFQGFNPFLSKGDATTVKKINELSKQAQLGLDKFMKSPFLRFFAFIGKVIGRILAPIGLAFGIFGAGQEAIQSFTEKYKDTNFIVRAFGAVVDGFVDFVAFFTTDLIDLIFDFLGFLLSRIAPELSKTISDISITGFLKGIVDVFVGIVGRIVNFIGALGAGALAAIGALMPGGETPMEAFERGYQEYMDNFGGMPAAFEMPAVGQAIEDGNAENANVASENAGNSVAGGNTIIDAKSITNNSQEIITFEDPTRVIDGSYNKAFA